jgi:hypothetical protein
VHPFFFRIVLILIPADLIPADGLSAKGEADDD